MDKVVARKLGKAVRAGLSPEEKLARDERIVARAKAELEWTRYRRAHVFLPIKRLGEIDTWPLVAWMWREWPEIEVYAPKLSGGVAQVKIGPETQFEVNTGGIPEPIEGAVLGGQDLDLVLTPLLAFDARGGRVGYGGGFYDRFLASQPRALRVGLAYEDCLVTEGIMTEGYDIRLHALLTEQKMWRF